MKVLLVSPEFSLKETKGLARYASEIYKKLKRKVNIDVVFRRGFHKGLLGFVFSLLYPNLSCLVKGYKYDVIHVVSPELGFFASLFFRKKTVVTIHDLFPITHWKKLKYKCGLFLSILSYLLWKVSMRAKFIVANSSLTKKYIRKIFNRKNVTVIHEGVEEKIKQIKKKNNVLTLCFVGNFSFRKRVDVALKVFRKLKEFETKTKLILVGGNLKSIYQVNFDLSEIRDPDIIFLDKIDDKKLIEVYSVSHFLIFPSIIEGFGLPIIEAVRCKTLPITFKYSEIPKEVKKLSIECRDVEDAVKKILYFWKNREEMKKMVDKFYEESRKYTWDYTCDKYLKIYKLISRYGKS